MMHISIPRIVHLSVMFAGLVTCLSVFNCQNQFDSENLKTTITVDDANNLGSVSFTKASSASYNESGTFNINVAISKPLQSGLSIYYTIDKTSSASSGNDYSILPAPIQITQGATSANISININNDTLIEGNETIIIDLVVPQGYVAGTNLRYTFTIADDDFITGGGTQGGGGGGVGGGGTWP